jgi:alanyl-tRNA synthetase
LQIKSMSKDAAIQMGAMALFGEKYDDEVRVVSVGDGYSTELCGGTHVSNTSQIGSFVIVSEQGVAAGVRRIVAYTSTVAFQFLREKAIVLDSLKERFKLANNEEVLGRVDKLQMAVKDLEKKIAANQAENAGNLAKELVQGAKKVGAVKFLSHALPEATAEVLKVLSERCREHLGSGVIALAAFDSASAKVSLLVTVSADLTKSYNAGKLIQASAPMIDGRGGGKPEQAQAGGTKQAGIPAALSEIEKLVASL